MQLHEYAAICCCSEKRKEVKMGSIQLFVLSEIVTLNTVLVLLVCYACEGSGALHVHGNPGIGSFRFIIMCQSMLYRNGMWQ